MTWLRADVGCRDKAARGRILGPLVLMSCVCCNTIATSGADVSDARRVEVETASLLDGGEVQFADADATDAVESLDGSSIEHDGSDDDRVSEADMAWPGTPDPHLLLCRDAFVDCVDVAAIKAPHLRHGGWLRIDPGIPGGVPHQLAVALDGVPFACASEPCDVEIDTSQYADGVTVNVAVRYGSGLTLNEFRSWTLPIFDCVLDEARPMCLQFGAWEPQEPVFEEVGRELFQGHSIVQRPDGSFAAALMVGPRSGERACRLLLATGIEGSWARSQVLSWDGPRDCEVDSGNVALATEGDELYVAYVTRHGVDGQDGLHVDRATGGSLASVAYFPSSFQIGTAKKSCGSSDYGLPDVILDLGLAIILDNMPYVLFFTIDAYHMISELNGDFECAYVSGTKDGEPRLVGRGVGSAVGSSRLLVGVAGVLHAVLGNYWGVFYQQYVNGAWTGSLFVDNPPIDYVWLALNAIAEAVDGSILHAYVVGYSDVALGVRRIRGGEVVSETNESLKSALQGVLTASGMTLANQYTPWGVEVRADACDRPHVMLTEHVDDSHLRFYSFSNLSGAWAGEWLAEIEPGPRVEESSVSNHDAFFFDAQGRQHLFYPIRPYPNEPEGTPSLLMHWIRPCEVYLTE